MRGSTSELLQKSSPAYWSDSDSVQLRSGAADFLPDANDGASLGASGTAWSDLFLASGAVIDFAAGNITLTHSTATLTLAGGVLTLPAGSATAVSLGLNDTDVGLYSGGANSLGIAAGGVRAGVDTVGIGVISSATIAWTDGAGSPFTTKDTALSRSAAGVLAVGTGAQGSTAGTLAYTASVLGGVTAGATTQHSIIKKVTGIADNTATDVFTVTVPNANHAAAIKVTFLSSNGSTDAFESSRVATGSVVLARTTGVTTVAAVSTLEAAQIATVAAGATHTLAYGVSAISGAAGATQTFTIQVTIDDTGNLGGNQVVALAELMNSEATGVTIA